MKVETVSFKFKWLNFIINMRTRSELIMCYYQEQLLQMHITQMQNIYVMLTVDSMRAFNLT